MSDEVKIPVRMLPGAVPSTKEEAPLLDERAARAAKYPRRESVDRGEMSTRTFTALVGAAWAKEEIAEFRTALHEDDECEQLDAVLDALGVLILLLGSYTDKQIVDALVAFRESQAARGRRSDIFHNDAMVAVVVRAIQKAESVRQADVVNVFKAKAAKMHGE